MQPITWFFDFISPFAYLQCEWLAPRIKKGLVIEPKPILFAGILNHLNHKGPAEMPDKRVFTYQHALWLAEQAGYPMTLPANHPFNPIPLLRLAIAAHCEFAAVRKIFATVWQTGIDAGSSECLEQAASVIGIPAPGEAVARQEVKTELIQNGEFALAVGVFGVPTLLVNDKPFWGYDAGEMALAYATQPSHFQKDPYLKAENLPIGTERRRP